MFADQIPKSSRCSFVGILITMLWWSTESAYPHSPAIWAEVKAGGQVHVEVYLSDGTTAKGARVLVQNAQGKVLSEGTTDDNGEFSFIPQRIQDLTIRVELDHAHTQTVTIPKRELRAIAADPPPP